MSLLTSASGNSAYRGYEYFTENKVLSCNKINDTEYEGMVEGSMQNPYSVHLNLKKPKMSTCDCPFATGLKICKHMVAVFFTVFPEEATKYKAELDAYYEEQEEREEELDDMLQKYIKKLSKSELQEALLQILYEGPEWQFDRFINEHIEW